MSTFDNLERELKQQLADIELHYRAMAAPIIDRLVHLESMKPPRPVYLAGQWFALKPGELEKLLPAEAVAKATESPGDRMHRLETERRQLLHLLRLILAAGGTLPHFLFQQVERTLKDLDP